MTDTTVKPSQASAEPTTLRVQGMDCGGCERKVEAALARLKHVEEVSASSVAGSVRLTAPPGKELPHAEIASTITALGYQVIDESADTADATTNTPWWKTPKGRLVLVSGALLTLAWALKFAWPSLGTWPFVAATVVGLVPIT